MKRRGMLILVLLMLVCTITACGRQADSSTVSESDTQSDITQAEEDGENSYTVNEILSDLTVDDISIGWPCKLEDIQKVFELGDAYSFADIPNVLCYDLYSNDNRVGVAWISEDNSAVLVLSLSYTLNDGIPFEFKGVTESSSYSDVISLLGTPTSQSEEGYRYIRYYDVEQDRTEAYEYDEIMISFKDDNIRLIEFYCSKNNIK
jgi:hypothetical protein